MPKRDPDKTARNKIINELTENLRELLPDVLNATGYHNEHSLHGKIGGKFATFIDIKNEVITSPQHFVSLWLDGFKTYLENLGERKQRSELYRTYKLLRKYDAFKEYLFLFLKRTYLRHYDALSKKRPKVEEAEIWIGQNNANYGILVTPRFVRDRWENDKSEIRHFPRKYWTIGHILHTGFVIPGKNRRYNFNDINEYLNFFLNVLVRNSGSEYEYRIAEMYCDYVGSSSVPELIPLLIPEFRYAGLEKGHKYRLDFTVIDPDELNKIGFELSPWSSHGYLKKVKGLSQKEINTMAKDNFETEMKKHKDYFRKHGIFILIYTDRDLEDIKAIFDEIKKYLEPKRLKSQLKFHIYRDFFQGDLL